MPPIYVKGGVWTNVEDEILKAAVQKYGLNHWDRVASLLTKKNAKQAKARWNEWLSPAINKSEWSREEDEKLLNLVKLLPNQWRSIAPIMNRTATHCIERYQKLLEDEDDEMRDEQQDELKYSGAGAEAVPAAGSNVGGLNINPESIPAKPDDDDMEDADREMLFEARARLANTKGKKAKRRERERMLDETKRISLLQKRRELKSAGVNVSLISKNKKKSKEFDYNADIPFEQQPQAGLYDTTEESQRNTKESADFDKQVAHKGLEMEKQKEKRKQAEGKGDKKPLKTIEGNADLKEPARKRTKLDLPGVVDVKADHGFEETELSGVLDSKPEPTSVDDIDSRIKTAMADIKKQESRKSTLLKSEDQTSVIETKVKTQTPKQERKAIIEMIKNIFIHLPAPKNEFEVLPKFDEQEEFQLVKISESESEKYRIKQMELLRQVEEEKAKSRRSQVVQRGLDIPNVSLLDNIDTSRLTELEKQILDEFLLLLKSDYKKYVDPTFDAQEVSFIDDDLFNKAKQEIEDEMQKNELKSIAIDEEDFHVKDLSPESKKRIVNAIIETNEANIKLRNELLAFSNPKDKINEIKRLNELIYEEDQKIQQYEEIAGIEYENIKKRTIALNALVDPLINKEQELTQYLRQL